MALRQQTGSIMLAAGADVVKSFVQNFIPTAASVVTELATGNIGINDNRSASLVRGSGNNTSGVQYSANRRLAAFARDKLMNTNNNNNKERTLQTRESRTLALSKSSLLSNATQNL